MKEERNVVSQRSPDHDHGYHDHCDHVCVHGHHGHCEGVELRGA